MPMENQANYSLSWKMIRLLTEYRDGSLSKVATLLWLLMLPMHRVWLKVVRKEEMISRERILEARMDWAWLVKSTSSSEMLMMLIRLTSSSSMALYLWSRTTIEYTTQHARETTAKEKSLMRVMTHTDVRHVIRLMIALSQHTCLWQRYPTSPIQFT